MYEIVSVLLWFPIIGKSINALSFHNNTHLLDQSNLYVSFRGVFRNLSNIWDGEFCEISLRLLAVNYYRKPLHFRYLRKLWIRICHLWHKFNICILNQVKREHILVNFLRFSLKDSSDKDFVFAGLENIFACSWIFKVVVEWIPPIRNSAEITFGPKYH